MMIGTWTGRNADGDKFRVVKKSNDFYEVERKGLTDEHWCGGLSGTAAWLGLE
jgi:hypothetical protein